jgi:tetratricopeptide (TPR) repeat protein
MSPPSWNDYLEDRRVLAVGALWLLAALGLSFVPLYRDFGFERAFAGGLVAAATGPALGAAAVERLTPRLGWLDAWLRALALHGVGVAALAAGGLLVEWWRQPCDPGEGAVFFLLIPGTVGALGISLGMWLQRGLGRRWWLGALAIVLLDLAATLVHAYREPQIFAFSLVLGWWPGSLYDELVQPSTALVAHRGIGVLYSLALVALGRAFEGGRARTVPLVVAIGLALTGLQLHRRGEAFGFETSAERIQRALGGHAQTPHFDIFFPRETKDEEVAALVRDHEYHWQRLRAWFGEAPNGRIRSYVHRSAAEKGRLMGASRTQIARPWALELHVHEVRTPHPTLGHELAHVFAAQWGRGLLRVPARWGLWVDMGLVEGLAEATEEDVGPYDHHQSSAFLLERGLAPSPARIMSPTGFWSVASTRAYAVAGSFLRWVRAEHGPEVIRSAYGAGGFAPDALRRWEKGWRRWLEAAVQLDPMARRAAEARHQRPSIFRRSCPHVTAALHREAVEAERRGDFVTARLRLDQAFDYYPEPSAHLRLARATLKAGRTELAGELARFVLTSTAAEATHVQAREILAGVDWIEGRLVEATLAYARLADAQTRFDGLRLQTARHAALASRGVLNPPSVSGEAWLRDYLLGRTEGGEASARLPSLVEAHPELDLLRYLWARRAPRDEARRQLAAVEALPPPLAWEVKLMLGRWAAEEGDYEAALRHFGSLRGEALPFEVESERDRALRRVKFRRNWPDIPFDVTRAP